MEPSTHQPIGPCLRATVSSGPMMTSCAIGAAGLEPVPRCEPSIHQPIGPCHRATAPSGPADDDVLPFDLILREASGLECHQSISDACRAAGQEPVPRCERSTHQPIGPCLRATAPSGPADDDVLPFDLILREASGLECNLSIRDACWKRAAFQPNSCKSRGIKTNPFTLQF